MITEKERIYFLCRYCNFSENGYIIFIKFTFFMGGVDILNCRKIVYPKSRLLLKQHAFFFSVLEMDRDRSPSH
jgi:hypothetical protein